MELTRKTTKERDRAAVENSTMTDNFFLHKRTCVSGHLYSGYRGVAKPLIHELFGIPDNGLAPQSGWPNPRRAFSTLIRFLTGPPGACAIVITSRLSVWSLPHITHIPVGKS